MHPNSTLNVYNTNNPPGPVTHYNLTIVNIGNYQNVAILPGHTNSYQPANNMVYIQNNGPSGLQALYTTELEQSPAEAGWSVVQKMPEAS